METATSAFRTIAERFPSLYLKHDESRTKPVVMSVSLPVQPGLKYHVSINLKIENPIGSNIY